jgi:hypothetical protein
MMEGSGSTTLLTAYKWFYKMSRRGCSFIGLALQVFEQYIYILKKREGELLTRLEAIHTVKFQTLEEQQQQLRYTVHYMTVSC